MPSISFSKGFTLVEVLVVLVILGLSSTMLVQSFNITWSSLSRLNLRSLAENDAKLGFIWFQNSVNHAKTQHPDDIVFEGNNNQFWLFSSYQLSSVEGLYNYRWSIQNEDLMLEYAVNNIVIDQHKVAYLGPNAVFEYQLDGQWNPVFFDVKGRLPSNIRIMNSTEQLIIARPLRDPIADTPAEMQVFGKYEFK